MGPCAQIRVKSEIDQAEMSTVALGLRGCKCGREGTDQL